MEEEIANFKEKVLQYSNLNDRNPGQLEFYFSNCFTSENVLFFCSHFLNGLHSHFSTMFSISLKFFIQQHFLELENQLQNELFSIILHQIQQKTPHFNDLITILSDILLFDLSLIPEVFQEPISNDEQLVFNIIERMILDSNASFLHKFYNQEQIDEKQNELQPIVLQIIPNFTNEELYFTLLADCVNISPDLTSFQPFIENIVEASQNADLYQYIQPFLEVCFAISTNIYERTDLDIVEALIHSSFSVANLYIENEDIESSLSQIKQTIDSNAIFFFNTTFSDEFSSILSIIQVCLEDDLTENNYFQDLISTLTNCYYNDSLQRNYHEEEEDNERRELIDSFTVSFLQVLIILCTKNPLCISTYDISPVCNYFGEHINSIIEESEEIQSGTLAIATFSQTFINDSVLEMLNSKMIESSESCDLNFLIFINCFCSKFPQYIENYIQILMNMKIDFPFQVLQTFTILFKNVESAKNYVDNDYIQWIKSLVDATNLPNMLDIIINSHTILILRETDIGELISQLIQEIVCNILNLYLQEDPLDPQLIKSFSCFLKSTLKELNINQTHESQNLISSIIQNIIEMIHPFLSIENPLLRSIFLEILFCLYKNGLDQNVYIDLFFQNMGDEPLPSHFLLLAESLDLLPIILENHSDFFLARTQSIDCDQNPKLARSILYLLLSIFKTSQKQIQFTDESKQEIALALFPIEKIIEAIHSKYDVISEIALQVCILMITNNHNLFDTFYPHILSIASTGISERNSYYSFLFFSKLHLFIDETKIQSIIEDFITNINCSDNQKELLPEIFNKPQEIKILQIVRTIIAWRLTQIPIE